MDLAEARGDEEMASLLTQRQRLARLLSLRTGSMRRTASLRGAAREPFDEGEGPFCPTLPAIRRPLRGWSRSLLCL
jgi:hypothetical protein